MKDLLLDANVVIRLLVQDDLKQSAAATALFEKAERHEMVLHLQGLIIAEIVYVLIDVYNRNRAEIADSLLALIQNAGVETADKTIASDALRRFASFNVDFADAWLAARAASLNHPVASFDRDFDKFKDLHRFEPKA